VEIYAGSGPRTKAAKSQGVTPTPPGTQIFQSTVGDVSPVIADVGGNVKIVCNGINPSAVQRLNQELSKLRLNEQSRLQRANEWAQEYKDQEAALANWGITFQDLPPFRRLLSKAAGFLKRGDLEQSGSVLEQLAGLAGKLRDDSASFHAEVTFSRARNLDLQFRFADALLRYKECYEEALGNTTFAFGYAVALDRVSDLQVEESVYNTILDELEAHPIPPLRPDGVSESEVWEAKVFNNLAGLYVATGRLEKLLEDNHCRRPLEVIPADGMVGWMVDRAESVFNRLFMFSPPGSSALEAEINSFKWHVQLDAVRLTAQNNRLIIMNALSRQRGEKVILHELPSLWQRSYLMLADLFQSSKYLLELKNEHLISADSLVNSFDVVTELSRVACREMGDPDALTPVSRAAICANLPRMTEEYLTELENLKVVFTAPVAVRAYRLNFKMLCDMPSGHVIDADNQSAAPSRFSGMIEKESTRAEALCLSLSGLNSSLYRDDCISFLTQEATYYEGRGASRLAKKAVVEMQQIASAVTAPARRSQEYEWIKYSN